MIRALGVMSVLIVACIVFVASAASKPTYLTGVELKGEFLIVGGAEAKVLASSSGGLGMFGKLAARERKGVRWKFAQVGGTGSYEYVPDNFEKELKDALAVVVVTADADLLEVAGTLPVTGLHANAMRDTVSQINARAKTAIFVNAVIKNKTAAKQVDDWHKGLAENATKAVFFNYSKHIGTLDAASGERGSPIDKAKGVPSKDGHEILAEAFGDLFLIPVAATKATEDKFDLRAKYPLGERYSARVLLGAGFGANDKVPMGLASLMDRCLERGLPEVRVHQPLNVHDFVNRGMTKAAVERQRRTDKPPLTVGTGCSLVYGFGVSDLMDLTVAKVKNDKKKNKRKKNQPDEEEEDMASLMAELFTPTIRGTMFLIAYDISHFPKGSGVTQAKLDKYNSQLKSLQKKIKGDVRYIELDPFTGSGDKARYSDVCRQICFLIRVPYSPEPNFQ